MKIARISNITMVTKSFILVVLNELCSYYLPKNLINFYRSTLKIHAVNKNTNTI